MSRVAAKHGLSEGRVLRSLAEAEVGGVVRLDEAGRPWFRHPLLASVLYDGIAVEHTRRAHQTFVWVLQSSGGVTPESVAADLAVHNHYAGRLDEAYRWSMTAADRAADLHATIEEAIHLERALWPAVSEGARGSRAERVELLLRASSCANRAGRLDAAATLLQQALELVDQGREPLLASTLLLARSGVMHRESVRGKTVVADIVDAISLTEPYPDSPERAEALAALAFAEYWDYLFDDARGHVGEAVQAALRSGSEAALARALATRALVKSHLQARVDDAQEAERVARSCGATKALIDAAIFHVHGLMDLGRTAEATEVALQMFDEAVVDEPTWAYFLASVAANGLLMLGRWRECRSLLRTAITVRCAGIAGAAVRLTAARLSARCGRVAEAQIHLERACELAGQDYAGLYTDMTFTTYEVWLAEGKPGRPSNGCTVEWTYQPLTIRLSTRMPLSTTSTPQRSARRPQGTPVTPPGSIVRSPCSIKPLTGGQSRRSRRPAPITSTMR